MIVVDCGRGLGKTMNRTETRVIFTNKEEKERKKRNKKEIELNFSLRNYRVADLQPYLMLFIEEDTRARALDRTRRSDGNRIFRRYNTYSI